MTDFCPRCGTKLTRHKRKKMLWCKHCKVYIEPENVVHSENEKGSEKGIESFPVAEGIYCKKCKSLLLPSKKIRGAKFCKRCKQYYRMPE